MSREETKQFCRECNNMLYPKEDKQEKMLYLACRNCEHFEEASSPVVYTVNYKDTVSKVRLSSAAKDIANDPTLRRISTRVCHRCRGTQHVVFQTKDIQEDSALTVNYVCRKCLKTENSGNVPA
ncbi:DNA-directed RNA polymerase II subunit RPB9 [Nematocida displodere]|uniref:DNA-directed RNA polymerase II subunit RPB9 n=1 Tax=Nematocida displodere TaxID=1805483 RepID=A0A177ED85_9MICR|nr:DNA-directed RNA polymerase II subunit RPB9 [Nematocida displodere]